MDKEQIQAIKESLKGLDEGIIDKAISATTLLIENNHNPQEIFPLGITLPDKAVIRVIKKSEDHDRFVNDISQFEDFRDRHISRLGIIINDFIETQIKIGG